MIDGRDLLLTQFRTAHRLFQSVVDDCSAETVNHVIDGATLGPIGAIYAHVVFDEDIFIHNVALGGEPLYARAEWAGRLGVAPHDGIKQTREWDLAVRMDPAAFRPYAQAVFAAAEEFLANAPEEALTREVESAVGPTTPLRLLSIAGLTHLSGHMSEIAAIKGFLGLKGLPF